MNQEYLEHIHKTLLDIRDGLLEDGISARAKASYELGMLVCSVNLTLKHIKEKNGRPKRK